MLRMLLDGMYDQMDQRPWSPRLRIYSAHDSTLTMLQVAMGIFNHRWPPYAADLCLELYKNSADQAYVRVMYCGKPMTLRGQTSAILPFRLFKDIICCHAVNMDEYWSECEKVGVSVDLLWEKCKSKDCPDSLRPTGDEPSGSWFEDKEYVEMKAA